MDFHEGYFLKIKTIQKIILRGIRLGNVNQIFLNERNSFKYN
jgi:hypothetical protein